MANLIVRTVMVFILLIVLLRILGKRQMGEMELPELVVSVLMANLASSPLQDLNIPLVNAVVPTLVLFACELLFSDITMHSIKLRTLLSGRPSILIKNGVIQQSQMHQCRFTVDELNEELRAHDISDISKVKYAVLETDGTLNAILYSAEQPATASQLGIQAGDLGYPLVVIEDGKVKDRNLRLSGHDETWLKKELERRGANSPKQVYLLIAYESGEVYYAPKEANPV